MGKQFVSESRFEIDRDLAGSIDRAGGVDRVGRARVGR